MRQFLVLANPSSHGGRSGRILPRLRALLPEGEFVALKNIEEASRLAREATGYEAVVACGGDGTVNAVAHGVLANRDNALKFGGAGVWITVHVGAPVGEGDGGHLDVHVVDDGPGLPDDQLDQATRAFWRDGGG